MRKVLTKIFFERNAVVVARDLIGKYLVRRIGRRTYAYKITETEAYDGPRDRASHASRGKTARNAVMFGKAGHFYIYFVYGFHHMLNVVTDKDGYPSAVLIRGLEGISGPGRLTKKLNITRLLNGKAVCRKTGFWFENRGDKSSKIKRTPRIGVAFAGSVWSRKLYRFVLE